MELSDALRRREIGCCFRSPTTSSAPTTRGRALPDRARGYLYQ